VAEARIESSTRLLVAVSGGVDSMVLLHVLSKLRPRLGFSLFAHGIDHGLRAEAGPELDLAERFASELDVPFDRSSVSLSAGGNLQARARAARYGALRERAKELGASLIATAHHADDRAETVLLRLLRGTSPRGLAVLPVRSADLVRPLIRARRRDIEAHAQRHRVPFSEDPSNRDPRYLRVRVRRELLPLLAELSPGIVDNLTTLADESSETALLKLSAPSGRPLILGRAQRRELARMLEAPSSSARLRLAGGHELSVDPATRHVNIVAGLLGPPQIPSRNIPPRAIKSR
jgi:tRNA(Ile)-lysidine synthase